MASVKNCVVVDEKEDIGYRNNGLVMLYPYHHGAVAPYVNGLHNENGGSEFDYRQLHGWRVFTC